MDEPSDLVSGPSSGGPAPADVDGRSDVVHAAVLPPLTVGRLLADTGRTYRDDLRLLLTTSGAVCAPLAAVVAVLYGAGSLVAIWPQLGAAVALGRALLPMPLVLVTGWLNFVALIQVVSDRIGGQPTDVRSALSRCARRAGPIFSAAVVRGVLLLTLTFLGTLLLILPGVALFVVLTIAWFLTDEVSVLEGIGGYEACRRSRALIEPRRATSAVFIACLLVANFAPAVLALLLEALCVSSASWFQDPESVLFLVREGAGVLMGMFVAPFVAAGGVHLYYRLREQAEGAPVAALTKQSGP